MLGPLFEHGVSDYVLEKRADAPLVRIVQEILDDHGRHAVDGGTVLHPPSLETVTPKAMAEAKAVAAYQGRRWGSGFILNFPGNVEGRTFQTLEELRVFCTRGLVPGESTLVYIAAR